MFPVLVFASHFQILLVRNPATQPECFTTHLVAPYRYISFVYNTQYASTHKTIYGHQKQKFLTISFRFAPLHRMCDATTLLHAQHTHSPELARSVDATSMTLRQVCTMAHFLDVYNPKIVYTGPFT
jgi:hypothetical protein